MQICLEQIIRGSLVVQLVTFLLMLALKMTNRKSEDCYDVVETQRTLNTVVRHEPFSLSYYIARKCLIVSHIIMVLIVTCVNLDLMSIILAYIGITTSLLVTLLTICVSTPSPIHIASMITTCAVYAILAFISFRTRPK